MQKRSLAACAITLIILIPFATLLLLEAKAASHAPVTKSPNLGIYSDPACTQTLTVLDWGKVFPGSTIYKTIYIKNLGSNQQRLSLLTENWDPTTTGGSISLTWNIENAKIGPNQVVAANLILTTSSTANGFANFAVDVTVKGTSPGH